jgi:hypothetical protein
MSCDLTSRRCWPADHVSCGLSGRRVLHGPRAPAWAASGASPALLLTSRCGPALQVADAEAEKAAHEMHIESVRQQKELLTRRVADHRAAAAAAQSELAACAKHVAELEKKVRGWGAGELVRRLVLWALLLPWHAVPGMWSVAWMHSGGIHETWRLLTRHALAGGSTHPSQHSSSGAPAAPGRSPRATWALPPGRCHLGAATWALP